MAALNYYVGATRGQNFNTNNVSAGTSSAGTSADVELRMQINTGAANTGLTKLDVIKSIELLKAYVEANGIAHSGANVPTGLTEPAV